MDNKDEFKILFDFLKNELAPLLGGALKIAIMAIGEALAVVVRIVGTFIKAVETAFNALKRLIDLIKNNPLGSAIGSLFSNASFSTGGNLVAAPGVSTPSVPEAVMFASPLEAARERGRFQNVIVNMGIVGDPESAARAINQVLQQSADRGTLGLYA
jgi:hypothetical protein